MHNIQCKDCRKDFTLTNEELDWYDKKGFPHPKRCKSCRAKKRIERGGE